MLAFSVSCHRCLTKRTSGKQDSKPGDYYFLNLAELGEARKAYISCIKVCEMST